jgi:hypothetical protein
MAKSMNMNSPTLGQYGFQRTHGLRKLAEYDVWNAMKQRCHNSKSSGFSKYGARGIAVCEEWRASFESFYRDMGPRPTPQHSIDRIDNQKGYAPENCCWATITQQANNKRATILINGKTLTAIATETGLARKMLETRYYRGLSPEEIMAPPKRAKRNAPSAQAAK